MGRATDNNNGSNKMSEQQEAVESKPPRKQRAGKQGSGSNGAFLATVIALVAAGGSYYLWQQYLVAERDRQALRQSIDRLLEVVEEKDRAQQARIDTLREHHHQGMEQRLAQLEQSLPELSQQLSVQQQNWSLAEVDYLLRLADHRLQLNRDSATAAAALRQARQLLTLQDNGQFGDVIHELEAATQQLNTAGQNDVAQISARLGTLLASLEQLPFALKSEQPAPVEPASAAPAEEGVGLTERIQRWGGMVWRDIRSLVTIRRSDEVERPLVNPQQRALLQERLQLKLETARLAALGHNQALYLATLGETAALLRRYFDMEASEVAQTIDELAALQTLNVDPSLPSLMPLRQRLHTASTTALPAAPAAHESGSSEPANAGGTAMESRP